MIKLIVIGNVMELTAYKEKMENSFNCPFFEVCSDNPFGNCDRCCNCNIAYIEVGDKNECT